MLMRLKTSVNELYDSSYNGDIEYSTYSNPLIRYGVWPVIALGV